MIIPCCQEATKENIKKSKIEIMKHFEKTGKEYCLIVNTGGKLEVVPKTSLDLIKSLIPNLQVL